MSIMIIFVSHLDKFDLYRDILNDLIITRGCWIRYHIPIRFSKHSNFRIRKIDFLMTNSDN